jgi:Cu/Ag efflux protein CusF
MTNQGRRIKVVSAALGGLLTLAVWSGLSQAQSAMGPATARRVHETVVVSAIDRTTRSVTLMNADGDSRTLGVPSDMKSFDTLKVGDHVDVDYSESIGLALIPAGAKTSMSETTTGGRAAEPGVAAVGRQITATVEVVGVDEVMNRVTFKGPKGNVRTVTVYDPAIQKKLTTLQPGQLVQLTYREALAASIKPTPSAQ